MNKLLYGLLFVTVVVVNTFLILIAVSVATGDTNRLFSFAQSHKVEPADIKTAQAEEKIPSDTVTISFVGDCTLGCFQGSDNQFGKYYAQNGADYFMSKVRQIFIDDDITCVNLEGPLTENPQILKKQYPIKGEPWYVNVLKGSGIEVCNLANNHIMDCGEKGFLDTVNVLENNDIHVCGEQHISRIVTNGATVFFLGYHGWEDTPSIRKQISDDIKACKDSYKNSIVCVQFHWGEERKYYPNTTQTGLAHCAIDSGADCVVGAHPHVIQGIEKYRGKVIAYSLGNFCFGANNNPSDKDTIILRQTYKNDGKIIKTEVIPCLISSRTDTNDFCPTVLSGTEGARVISRMKDYSRPFAETIDMLKVY